MDHVESIPKNSLVALCCICPDDFAMDITDGFPFAA